MSNVLDIQLEYGGNDQRMRNVDDVCRGVLTAGYDLPFQNRQFRKIFVSYAVTYKTKQGCD